MNCRNTTTPRGQRTRWWGKAAALGAFFALGLGANAQVSAYSFSQSSGTYTPLSASRTIAFTATALATVDPGLGDDRNFTLPAGTIPFTFTFNGVGYTGVNINTNGYVTFGATLPLTTDRLGISNATAWSGSIAARGGDLSANTNAANLGEISWEVLGTAPNRTFAIQYARFRRFSSSSTFSENYNFQILLNENGNTVQIVYGPCVSTGSSSAQVGLRGATNADFNNRTSTTSWAATTAGTVNTATITHSTTVNPVSGQTFTWTPPPPCTGTPTAGSIPASSGFCGPTGAVTLTATGFTSGVTGISFQWEESDDNGVGDAWANAVGGTGATTASYTSPALSNNIFYRLRVTCSNGGGTATTNSAAITVANCQFNIARNTGITYSSIMSTGLTYTTLNAVTNLDDNITNTVSLAGTSFRYKGQPVTGFRSSTNGWMTFNTATTSTAFNNNIGSNATTAVLAPFWEDLICTGWTSGTGTQAMLNGSMRYQVNGTLGSGTAQIIIEWAGMETFSNPGPNLNFQVVLNEAGNTITYNYGTMEGFNGSLNYGYAYTIGMNAWSFPTLPASFTDVQGQRDDNTTNFEFASSNTANSGVNARLYLPECNSQLVFTPTAAYAGPGAAPTIVPANDEATTATPLTVNAAPCTSLCNTYYRNQGGTASAGITACGAVTPGTPDDDVWFSFVATTTGAVITVRGGGGMDPVVQLFSDQGITPLNCVNATGAGLSETITNNALTAGNTYWVRVYHAGTGANGLPTTGFTTAGVAQFSICVNEVVPPPANDNICGAINLTVNPTCVTTSGNTLNATASTQAVCGGLADDDIWYSFTAATSNDQITVQSIGSFNAHLQVFSSSDQTCNGTLTSLTCTNVTSTGGAETYSGPWTAGNTYFVRVYHTLSGAASGQFTICVTATAPACATGLSPANAAIVCGNATPQNITWTATPGATGYDVFFDAGAGPASTLVSSNQAGTSYDAGVLAFGQYTYRIVPRNAIGAATGCTDVTFNVNAIPTATITASGPTTFCTPGSVDLTASAGGSYLWAPGGATTQTITVSTSGSYTVQVTTAGCSATSTATVVTANQSPSIASTTATPGITCPGQPSQLQVTMQGPSTYCQSTHTSGCSGDNITNITLNTLVSTTSACGLTTSTPPRYLYNTTETTTLTAGSPYTLTLSFGSDGNQYFGAWIDYNNDGTLAAGEFLGASANAGANGTTSVNFTVPAGATNGVLRLRIIGGNDSPLTAGQACGASSSPWGETQDYNVTIEGGVDAFTYLWDNAGSLSSATIANPIATPTVTTTYQVTVTAANGCTTQGSATVTMDVTDTDNDGITDCVDTCPTVTGQNGDACNAGPNFVLGTLVNCVCVGVQCTTDLNLVLGTDLNGQETTWEIRTQGTNLLVQSGGGWYPPNAALNDQTCLPDGCFRLTVFDSAGDGMTTGGYILQTAAGARIIDNRNNFSTGFTSAISGGQGFCLPLSTQTVLFTSCDKLDWVNGQYMVATPNAAVSAEWIPNGANSVQDNNSGYEFWIFDPNGSYSFRRFRSHNVSDGFGPASATRACHMRVNNWAPASQIPQNTLMNVRVRTRINGVNGEFGPACRMAVNPVLAACPQTQLFNIPGDPDFSCGVTRQWGAGNFVFARPVSGANRYQFRFRIAAEGFSVTRTATTYFVQLNWATLPLQNGKTYDVDVRVSKDGGLTWCSSSDPWGPVCQVTIGAPNFNAMSATGETGSTKELRMFPNPNRGDVLNVSLTGIEEGVNTVSVDIYDLTGKRMSARTLAVAGNSVITTMDLSGELAAGMYLVNITAGGTSYTERLVIQP